MGFVLAEQAVSPVILQRLIPVTQKYFVQAQANRGFV
jgi:hypothetical protein